MLAARAGEIMRAHFRPGAEFRTKADGSPVTAADEAVNSMVLDAVRDGFPADGVIGEEGSSPPGSSDRVWVCDPIDGTMPFTLGVPTSMFSLALVVDGEPVLGVLYDPVLDRLYEAERGSGARVNGDRLSVSDAGLAGSIVSLPVARYGLTDNAALLADGISRGLRVLAVGAITYECALVASGQLTACVFAGESVWDVAAVAVIVEEAGGRVTAIDGGPQRYDGPVRGALVSNGRAHADLVDLVRPHLLGTDPG